MVMRTVSRFDHKGHKVQICKYAALTSHGSIIYRASLNGDELPHNARELERALRTLIDGLAEKSSE